MKSNKQRKTYNILLLVALTNNQTRHFNILIQKRLHYAVLEFLLLLVTFLYSRVTLCKNCNFEHISTTQKSTNSSSFFGFGTGDKNAWFCGKTNLRHCTTDFRSFQPSTGFGVRVSLLPKASTKSPWWLDQSGLIRPVDHRLLYQNHAPFNQNDD